MSQPVPAVLGSALQLNDGVGAAEARVMLAVKGTSILASPLRAVARVWVPYYLFEIAAGERGADTTRTLALDALEGTLDLLEIDSPTVELSGHAGANHLIPALGRDEADGLMADRLLRMTFLRGFFRVRGALPRPRSLEQLLYVPYWVGFYGEDEVSRVRVVDAVRRTVEGGKAVDLISRSLGVG